MKEIFPLGTFGYYFETGEALRIDRLGAAPRRSHERLTSHRFFSLNKPMTRAHLRARMSRRAQEPISHKPTVDPGMAIDGSERSNDGDFNDC
jgi:hypothetical protein